jgi:hypothetical protein
VRKRKKKIQKEKEKVCESKAYKQKREKRREASCANLVASQFCNQATVSLALA